MTLCLLTTVWILSVSGPFVNICAPSAKCISSVLETELPSSSVKKLSEICEAMQSAAFVEGGR